MKRPVLTLVGILVVAAVLGLASCSEVGYVRQCAVGQFDLLARRQPIEKVLSDPATPEETRTQLRRVLAIRDFATRDLALPENGSYRSYADLGRSNVVWNIVAAPEFSLKPKTWCFPIAGCVSYRGYFSEEEAGLYADGLRDEGFDVYLYGVTAYSTLGWFDDPVLNTFFSRNDASLAGLIFHELAHQEVYLKNDSSFNEAFAKTVEREGVLRWLRHSAPDQVEPYLQSLERKEVFLALLQKTRSELETLYGSDLPPDEKRTEKEAVLDRLREEYAALVREREELKGYEAWLSKGLNNAKLASVATYHAHVEAFQELLRLSGGDLPAFYREASRLAKLPAAERQARLAELAAAFKSRRAAKLQGNTDSARNTTAACRC